MRQNIHKTSSPAGTPLVTHDVVFASPSLPVGAIGSAKQALPTKDAPTKGLATCNPAPNATAPSVPAGSHKQILNW